MKNNNKNRKLNFIRVKNNLRLGIVKFYLIEKRCGETKINEKYFIDLIEKAKKLAFKQYKITLRNTEIQSGIIDDDFVKNIITYKICLSN